MNEHGEKLPPGKVPWEIVADKITGPLPPEVLLGPSQGEDAALVKIGEETWAVASDPVTFTSSDAGKLSVIINANDVAVRGATPRFYTAVVLASPDAGQGEVGDLLAQIRKTSDEMGIALIGGHTEVTPGLPHVIVAGTMLGKVDGRPIHTGGLKEGDLVGMTKWAGLEGISILLGDMEEQCRKILGEEDFRRAREFFAKDFISVVPEARAAACVPSVSALHDVTEGGVGEALHELASASGTSLEISREKIPILPETEKICASFNMDPLGLIGSGALLVGCRPDGKGPLEKALSKISVQFTWIGIAKKAAGLPSSGLPRFERDEILKAFPKD